MDEPVEACELDRAGLFARGEPEVELEPELLTDLAATGVATAVSTTPAPTA